MNRILITIILFLLCLSLYAIDIAPLNPEFIDYMRYGSINKEINEYEGAVGCIPSPILPVSTWIESDVKRGVFPESYDLRDENRVSPIKNQNPWGSCWSFGTTSSIESNVRTNYAFSGVDYSEFNIVRESSLYGRTLNSGGNYLDVMHYLARFRGPVNETSDPYITNPSLVNPNSPMALLANQPAPVAFVENVSLMPVSFSGKSPTILDEDGNINQDILNVIKSKIMTNGAVDFSFYIHNSYLSANKGYYCPTKHDVNHEISIVGWDDNYSTSNFYKSPPGKGAFLARNSWGTGWGDNGYFWISYYDKTACNYSSFNSVTLDTSKYDKAYLNDYGGWLASANYKIARSRFIIESNTMLKAVSTYVYIGGLAYNINIYVNSKLVDNIKGNFGYSGYITIPLKKSISLMQNDELIVEVNYDANNASNEKYIIPVEVDVKDFYTGKNYKSGQSYIFTGQWEDVVNYKWNTCIHALTKAFNVVVPVAAVILDKSAADMKVGDSLQLTATVIPSNATNKNVVWSSSNTKVATVVNGAVKAVALGTADIVVKTVNGNKTFTCKITVIPTPVTGITLDKTVANLVVGDSLILTSTIIPSNATNKNVVWSSSDVKVATVTARGNAVVKAIAVGIANIVVKTVDGNKTATCKVIVSPVSVTGVTLNKTTASMVIGESLNLVPTIIPSNAANKNVTWTSSNRNVATVDSDGSIHAIAVGTANIVVNTVDGNKTAACKITVASVSVTGVKLDKSSVNMKAGDSLTLVPTIIPGNASNKNVIWSSSNAKIATVAGGVVKGIAVGTANIVVKTIDGSKTAACKVTVIAPVSVTGVKLDKITANMVIGDRLTLVPTITPSNATNKSVTWSSSNTKVATVVSGDVKAISAGSANITVKTVDSNKTAACKVTVTAPVFVTGVKLDKIAANMVIGDSLTLVPTIIPSNATNKNVTWSSSNTNIATVINGVVKAIAVGTANIVVNTVDGSKTAICKVTVMPVLVTGITLNKTNISMKKGTGLTLIATVIPSNATNKNVTWSSSNTKVATVVNGAVKAIAVGTTNIVVKTIDGNKTAVCKVTVTLIL